MAIIAPVLIAMLFGGWNISRALIAWPETSNATQAGAQALEAEAISQYVIEVTS